jgi:hypothetical protein
MRSKSPMLVSFCSGIGASSGDEASSAGIDEKLHSKLAKAGLVVARASVTLGEFLDGYISSRSNVQKRTTINFWQAARNLTEYFGGDRHLDSITQGDCDQWRVWMLERLGENTVWRHCGRAKQFFRAAMRHKLLNENPFADMKNCGVQKVPLKNRHDFRHGTRQNCRERARVKTKNPSKFQWIPRGSSLFRLRIAQERTRTDDGNSQCSRQLAKPHSAGAAESGAVDARGEALAVGDGAEKPADEAALGLLCEVWSELPELTRNRILRLADEALRVAR